MLFIDRNKCGPFAQGKQRCHRSRADAPKHSSSAVETWRTKGVKTLTSAAAETNAARATFKCCSSSILLLGQEFAAQAGVGVGTGDGLGKKKMLLEQEFAARAPSICCSTSKFLLDQHLDAARAAFCCSSTI
ncbi:hypothetical protein DPMN_153582 [Dreissena polymorpha]|uniref:Uncharacterized protein n=1 Tax=Dreissena polymorpha TaxID=45954 RepID=A0A9D4FJF3_DREPO|nr:hypothetical protein DPMN_153582 [Dreissena polymorpha]